jgi:hypothetical protein
LAGDTIASQVARKSTDTNAIGYTRINHRRIQLQYKASSLGARVFAEKPKAFGSRIEAYWHAWRPADAPEPAGVAQLTLAAYAASQH